MYSEKGVRMDSRSGQVNISVDSAVENPGEGSEER